MPCTPILVAEDSAVIQTVLREMLKQWGYHVLLARDGAEAWDALHAPSPPRMAIVDWMMPRMSGPELCRRLRAETRETYTYLLMLTSRAEAEDVLTGFNAGADDYLTKPFHAQELSARVRTGARIVRMQQELREAREALRARAATDELTRLPNRYTILETLDRELAVSDETPVSILLVYVDRFRQINEMFGTAAGDLVLRECAVRIGATTPARAIAGRHSSKEFLVILPNQDRQEAAEVGGRIRAAISGELFHSGAASFPVTCSVGAATREGGGSEDAASLLRSAGESLLGARAEARERIVGALRASQLPA